MTFGGTELDRWEGRAKALPAGVVTMRSGGNAQHPSTGRVDSMKH